MRPPDYQNMPKAFGPLLDEPTVPVALRNMRRLPPAGIAFRAFEQGDKSNLFSLFNEPTFLNGAATRDAFETEEDMHAWFDGITTSDRFEIVASSSNQMLGFAGLYPQCHHMRHTGFLILGVSAAAQGQGIGTFLVQLTLLTAWFVAGLNKIALTVFTDNAQAIRLYTSAGFEIEGLLRRFVERDGQGRDAYAMAILL